MGAQRRELIFAIWLL